MSLAGKEELDGCICVVDVHDTGCNMVWDPACPRHPSIVDLRRAADGIVTELFGPTTISAKEPGLQ